LKLIISQMQMDGKLSLKIEGATKEERRGVEDLEGFEVKVIAAQTEIPIDPTKRMEFILAKARVISEAAEAIRAGG
jgi:hypothetical protein